MSEKDYVIASDITRIRIMKDIILMVNITPETPKNEIISIEKLLWQWEIKLEALMNK